MAMENSSLWRCRNHMPHKRLSDNVPSTKNILLEMILKIVDTLLEDDMQLLPVRRAERSSGGVIFWF
jgi:hypothetical protein